MVGQVYPWKKGSDEPRILALLVPIENALAECLCLDQDLTKTRLTNLLKEEDIRVFKNIDEFVNLKKV